MVEDRSALRKEGDVGVPRSAGRAAVTVWFTGLSCAGKTTLSKAVFDHLQKRGLRVEMLDGDEIRKTLCNDLGFSKRDRDENIRRIVFVARLLARNGVIVLVSVVSPFRAGRAEARRCIGSFIEVYVNAPVEVCEKRDVKGLYRKFQAGEISGVSGIDCPYEPPESPEVECCTDCEMLEESVAKVLRAIALHGSCQIPRQHNSLAISGGSAQTNGILL